MTTLHRDDGRPAMSYVVCRMTRHHAARLRRPPPFLGSRRTARRVPYGRNIRLAGAHVLGPPEPATQEGRDGRRHKRSDDQGVEQYSCRLPTVKSVEYIN